MSLRERFEIIADKVAKFIGTPLFVILQTLVMTAWIIIAGILVGIDRYPFILLTLLLSVEAIYLGCFILVSTNRADMRHDEYEERDRQHREELWADAQHRDFQILEILDVVHMLQQDVHDLTKQIDYNLRNPIGGKDAGTL